MADYMSRFNGKEFPLVDSVVVLRGLVDAEWAASTAGAVVLPAGTVVVFVGGTHGERYNFQVKDTGMAFSATEDALMHIDINPLWD